MTTRRIIPIFLLKGKRLVKGINFSNHIDVGDPLSQAMIYSNHHGPCSFRSQPHRFFARRGCADRAVQLAVRPAHRRCLRAACRGYRPRTQPIGADRGDPGWLDVVGARVGRRAVSSGGQLGAAQAGCAPAARYRSRLPVLLRSGTSGGITPDGARAGNRRGV